MHTFLVLAGFTPALRERTKTHRDGNQLDQLWTRNIAITNAIVADPIDQVSDHGAIQVKMEAVFVQREQAPQQDPGEVDLKTLPQATIRKVIKECVAKGLFDASLHIDSRPMLDYVPQEVANRFRPQPRKGRTTIRYSPAQKAHETPEMLQIAGELHNHKVLDQL